ncbi:MAG: hypothetical protein ACK46A_14785, partial [Akkermansiaceae bacterium]
YTFHHLNLKTLCPFDYASLRPSFKSFTIRSNSLALIPLCDLHVLSLSKDGLLAPRSLGEVGCGEENYMIKPTRYKFSFFPSLT